MPKPSLFKNPVAYYRRKWHRHKFKHTEVPDHPVVKTINGVQFDFNCSLSPLVKKMYLGIYEHHIVKAIRKNLKAGDVFFDIGANIGYTAAIGAGCVGTQGQVHCFEPTPMYFEYLSKLPRLNPDHHIVANNFALGEEEGECTILTSNRSNIGLNTVVHGLIKPDEAGDSYTVKMRRLDNYIRENKIQKISLIKIDVEGFEIQVLKGASGFFKEQKKALPPIIVEVSPPAYKFLDTDVKELEELMEDFGYTAYTISGRKKMDIKKIIEQEDVLFRQRA